MIFVTIGTSEPFDRLLLALDSLPSGEELVVQSGTSRVAPGVDAVDFLSYEEVVENVKNARVVITHAGAGSVMTCLAQGKRPVVVPRLRAHGETADDHQLAFARRLSEAGLATLVEDVDALAGALDAENGVTAVNGSGGLIADLRDYLTEAVAR
jgi:UDP-N-acetylglucosamine transferase subunit ALG13